MWGRGPRGNNATCSALCQLSVTSPTTHKQIGPFWCWFQGGYFCVCSRTLWVPPTVSPVKLSPTTATTIVFYSRRFWDFYFSGTWVVWSVSLSSCSSCFICTWMWDRPVHQPPPPRLTLQLPPCSTSSPARLPVYTPPTSLDECFFFNFLFVGLPYRSIFWQFWLFFVFKCIVLLLVVQRDKVYLLMPPSWPEVLMKWLLNRDLNEVRKQGGKMWRLAPLQTYTSRGKNKDPKGICLASWRSSNDTREAWAECLRGSLLEAVLGEVAVGQGFPGHAEVGISFWAGTPLHMLSRGL